MKHYTEGIASDGAAILEDGIQITITEILKKLNKLAKIEDDYEEDEGDIY